MNSQISLPDLAHDPLRQVAFITRDARAAAERHSRMFGSGPFLLTENEQRLVCRGKETQLQHIAAFGKCGAQMIEFFQPVKASTPEMEELIWAPPSGARFHHVALLVEDLEATVLRFSTASFPMYYALPFPTYPLKPHGSIREQNRPLGGGVFR